MVVIEPFVVGDRYEVFSRLGKGGFGQVVAARDLQSGKDVALKLEKTNKGKSKNLAFEARILIKLSNAHIEGLVRMYACGFDKKYNFIAMELLGQDLNQIRKARWDRKYPPDIMCELGLATIKCIEAVHNFGFVHNDIKAANFVMIDWKGGPNGSPLLKLIDFGLVSRYKNKDGSLIVRKGRRSFRGTRLYCSPNAHARLTPSPRDDLISWAFMLIEMHLGHLPWGKASNKYEIQTIKSRFVGRKAYTELPPALSQIMNITSSLAITDVPDYKQLSDVLQVYLTELRADKPAVATESMPSVGENKIKSPSNIKSPKV